MKFALLVLISLTLLSTQAKAEDIYVRPENGEWTEQAFDTTNLESGTYLFEMFSGPTGPWLLDQCEDLTPIEAKRQCRFSNLTEKLVNDISRVSGAELWIDGKRYANKVLLNRSKPFTQFPLTVTQGQAIKVRAYGYPSSWAYAVIRSLPEENMSPYASFTVNRMHGYAPVSVTFNAATSFDPNGGAVTYNWNFGDGSTSTDLKPTHIYQNPGTYAAKLTVTDSEGLSSDLDVSIVVNPPVPARTNALPVGMLNASYPDSTNLRAILFSTNGSYDPDGTIEKTEIFFGDGAKAETHEATHVYRDNGTYLVKVRLTDNEGATRTIEKSIEVIAASDLSVEAEVLNQTHYGSFSSQNIVKTPLEIGLENASKIYRITAVNADGQPWAKRTCAGTLAEKTLCAYNNLLTSAYIALYRMDWLHVYVNGKRITDNKSINKTNVFFQSYVTFTPNTNFEIRFKGWPTAYVDLKVERMIVTGDTTPPVLSLHLPDGSLTKDKRAYAYVDDMQGTLSHVLLNGIPAISSTEKAIPFTLTEGPNRIEVQSADASGNIGEPLVVQNITLDTIPPNFTTSLTGTTYVRQIPASISSTITVDEASTLTINEVPAGEAGTSFQVTYPAQATGKQSWIVKAYDLAGNMRSRTFSTNVIVDDVVPLITLTTVDLTRSRAAYVNIPVKIQDATATLTTVKVNGTEVLQTASKGFTVKMDLLLEGENTFSVESKDLTGNTSQAQLRIVRDTTAPILSSVVPQSGGTIHRNGTITGEANEELSKVTVNGKLAILNSDKKGFSYAYASAKNGLQNYSIVLTDLVGNTKNETFTYTAILDSTAPILSLNYLGPLAISGPSIMLPVSVIDETEVWTEIFVNGQKQLVTRSKSFTVPIYLDIEGVNEIRVQSIDEAGNAAAPKTLTITKDTTGPVLSYVTPTNGAVVNGLTFTATLSSNEALLSAEINGYSATISGDKLSLSGTYTAASEGNQSLTITARDLLGNTSTKALSVYTMVQPLNQQLIGIYPDEMTGKLKIVGAVGAVRPNTPVKLSASLFNSVTVTSTARGSFEALLEPFNSVKVSLFDQISSREYSATIAYGSETFLSGQVREINDVPLAGVTVRITGTTVSVKTDANGVFKFSRALFPSTFVTGDQELTIDGTTAELSEEGPAREFAISKVIVTIGIGQSNVLQTPIYLAPIYLDDSSTTISKSSGGVVEDIHAPGVKLEIPAGAAQFPGNDPVANISVIEIPAAFSTVAPVPEAMPKTVIALEPSGTSFAQPVKLTLPNSNEFPPNTEMAIMLMNSKTGKWEFGGAAKVSSDGSSVVTKDGMGIKHFSQAYATIPGPNIWQASSDDKPGLDTMMGSVKNEISLPSFKVKGQAVTPTLSYRSAWAKPAAVVNAILDFPERKINAIPTTTSYATIPYQAEVLSCDSTGLFCSKSVKTFYTRAEMQTSYENVTSKIQPQSIEASFKPATLPATDYKYVSDSQNPMPERSVFSFHRILKSDEDNQYLSSGAHPYEIDFKVEFKELTMGTYKTKYWTPVTNAGVSTGTFTNYRDGVFAQTLAGNLFLQNYEKSSAGRGWRIQGVKRIFSANGAGALVETENGDLEQFAMSNTITTLVDLNTVNGDASKAIGLQAFPVVTFGSKTARNEILQLDISSNAGATSLAYKNTSYIGEANNADTYMGARFLPYCYSQRVAFEVQLERANLFKIGNKTILSDAKKHAIFDLDASVQDPILGTYSTPPFWRQLWQGNVPTYPPNSGKALAWCNSNGYYCNLFQTDSYQGDCRSSDRWNLYSIGRAPQATSAVSGGIQGLNRPAQVVGDNTGNGIYVADTGNHVVRRYDFITKQSQIVAGNGQANDLNGTGLATGASIYHPHGLAIDAQGNLYISSANGYIRKVTPQGQISTIAGNPSVPPASESDAMMMKLSSPTGLAIDRLRNFLYVADTGQNRIVRIDLSSGVASAVAGNLSAGTSGDNGPATAAQLNGPTAVHLDSDGNLIVADTGNNKIRKISFQSSATGQQSYSPLAKNGSTLIRNQSGTWTLTERSGTVSAFDAQGLHLSTTDRTGDAVTYLYDGNKNLSVIRYPTGQETQMQYAGGRLSHIIDAAGRTTQFTYSSTGDLEKVQFPDGSTRLFTYNASGLMNSEKDQRGFSTNYAYNQFDRIETVTKADGSKTKLNDLTSTNLINFAAGSTGYLMTTGLSSRSLNNEITDSRNNSTRIMNDLFGRPSVFETPDSKLTQIVRDQDGYPIAITRPDGSKIEMLYDPVTKDLLTTKDVGTGIMESRTFNSFGQVTSETDGRGNQTQFTYYPNGQLQRKVSGDGTRVEYSYNTQGLPTERRLVMSPSADLVTTYQYDSDWNLTRVTNPDGKTRFYTYDQAGNLTETKVPISGSTYATTSYEYNQLNLLVKVTTPNSDITEYSYLPSGQLSEIKDAFGKTTTFTYDSLGRLLTRRGPSNDLYSFAYDSNGNRTSETDPKGQVRTFTYDELDQVTKVQYPDDTVLIEYDLLGRVSSIENGVAELSYHYDTKGRQVSSSYRGKGTGATAFDYTQVSTFDRSNNRISTQVGSFATTAEYDAGNKMTWIQSNTSGNFMFGFDKAQRINQIQRPGTVSTYGYTAGSMIAAIYHKSGSQVRSFHEYIYDLRNAPAQKRNVAGTVTYGYDQSGQLTSADSVHDPESFAYDLIGNRTQSGLQSLTYDESKQRLVSDGTYSYLFDANGNVLSKTTNLPGRKSYNFSYNSKNQLVRAEILSAPLGMPEKVVEMFYDPVGRRVVKSVTDNLDIGQSSVRQFEYDGDDIVGERNGSSLIVSYTHSKLAPDDVLGVYFHQGASAAGLIPLNFENKRFFPLKDSLGSTTEITDEFGQVLQRYDYSTFGKILKIQDGLGTNVSSSPPIVYRFTFTGRELDQETELYYYRARYYDATTGRFLQTDPHPGNLYHPLATIGKFNYAMNSPLMYRDHDGRFPWLAILAAGLVGGTINMAVNGWTTQNFAAGFVSGVVGTTIVLTGAWIGAGIGGLLAGGSTVGVTTGAAVGGAVAGGAWGYYTSGNILGAIVGAGFGFLGGAMYGASRTGTKIPGWMDIPIDPPTSTPTPTPPPPATAPTPYLPDNQGPVPIPGKG